MLGESVRPNSNADTRRIQQPHGTACSIHADADHLVRTLPGLRDISGPAWERALASATLATACPGTRIAASSCDGAHFTVVLRGELVLRGSSADGRVFNMYKVRPGEVCTLSLIMLQLKSGPVPVSEVVAEGPLLLIRIPARYLDPLLAQSQSFRELMTSSLIRCVTHALGLIEEVTFDRLQTRLERHLREMHQAGGSEVLRVGHQALATELGSTREGISRLLKQMERGGLIRLGRGAITLLPPIMR
jgi:CRP/FNR family transcriptional regulator, anaerobic regulatory protein